jgi:hypothetical protein
MIKSTGGGTTAIISRHVSIGAYSLEIADNSSRAFTKPWWGMKARKIRLSAVIIFSVHANPDTRNPQLNRSSGRAHRGSLCLF